MSCGNAWEGEIPHFAQFYAVSKIVHSHKRQMILLAKEDLNGRNAHQTYTCIVKIPIIGYNIQRQVKTNSADRVQTASLGAV